MHEYGCAADCGTVQGNVSGEVSQSRGGCAAGETRGCDLKADIMAYWGMGGSNKIWTSTPRERFVYEIPNPMHIPH